jgi:hypothetical protein
LTRFPGAHRASPHRRARITLALTFAAALLTVGGAFPAGVSATTTTIDRPWYTVEQFYLGLANCTRTGGWVLSDGTCRGYGSGYYSRYFPPFHYSSTISDYDSRRYAKLLATTAQCTHYADGDPGYRLRRIGLTHWTWGENIGCRDGYSSVKAAVLASHLVFQSERSTNGGHWQNLKNQRLTIIGIGVWWSNGRTRLVTDFYG